MLTQRCPCINRVIDIELAGAIHGDESTQFGVHRAAMVAFQGVLDDQFPVGMHLIADRPANLEPAHLVALVRRNPTKLRSYWIVQLILQGSRVVSKIEENQSFP